MRSETIEAENPSAAPKYVVESATGSAGKTVDVYVSIENNPGIVSLRNSISYDSSAIELIKVENTGLLNGFTTPYSVISSPYTLRWADSLATENNTANGNIIKLTFSLKWQRISAWQRIRRDRNGGIGMSYRLMAVAFRSSRINDVLPL